MIPELGHFSLILAFCLTGLQSILPFIGIYRNHPYYMRLVFPLVIGQCFFITLSFFILLYSFVQDDFSILYVAQNSNSTLPLIYKISALWGGHEGSLLLWGFLLSLWGLMVSLSSRNLPLDFLVRVLIILGVITFGFLLFLLFVSNPFQRLLPQYPIEGRDLNPVLQDPGFIIHPPLLYMGYVGCAVPFAFALSALWKGEKGIPWAKWIRPWLLLAWGFLTLGITVGSWWAYYELGWGGWWFWDPVENASFMPWLLGIALIHSLIVSDKRHIFQSWTLLLAIGLFALSLLGTFLVRSGILTSVHSFATDPKRGIFLLEFLVVIVGGALLLYAVRGKKFFVLHKVERLSRETLMLFSNLLLVISTLAILLGTLFPIVYEVFSGQKLTVGFPYFNRVFILLIIPVLVLVPLGPLSQWGLNVFKNLFEKLQYEGIVSLLLVPLLLFIFTKTLSLSVYIGLSLSTWIALGTLKAIMIKIKKQGGIRYLSLGALGMLSAHLGVAVLVMGVTLVSHYQIEREVEIRKGQSLMLSQDEIRFDDMHSIEGENYVGYQGHFTVLRKGKKIKDLYPEKRLFVVSGLKMTETAIAPGFLRDIYIALGEPIKEGSWSARIYYKPFVRWIWLGGLMISLGSFLAAIARRYRT